MTGPLTGPVTDVRLAPVLPAWLVLAGAALLALLVLVARRRPRPGPAADRGGTATRLLLVAGVALLLLHPLLEGPSTTTAGEVPARQVLVVVDRTTSMAAEDWDASRARLEGARRDVERVVGALPGARFGLVAWGSEPREVVPFTTDGGAFVQALDATRAEGPTDGRGSSLDRPRPSVADVLERAAEQFPDRGTVLLLLSDGEDTSGEATTPWRSLRDLVDGGLVLGYGTADGATIPLPAPVAAGPFAALGDPAGPSGPRPLVRDPDTGRPATSRLDAANLRRVADDLGLDYRHRTAPDGDLAAWARRLPAPEASLEREAPAPLDPTWVVAAAVLGLGLVEVRRWWRELHAVRRGPR